MELNKKLQPFETGMTVLSQNLIHGADQYIQIRRQEGRLLDDSTVLTLPYLPRNHHLFDEWAKRTKSAKRFLTWIGEKRHRKILDLGCGNGWFTGLLSKHRQTKVYGVDINRYELDQATRLFERENCQFLIADIFDEQWPESYFDIIVLNSSVQYFPDLNKLLIQLSRITKKGGEIHILDTYIYERHDLERAKQRSFDYFNRMKQPEMYHFYFHHTWDIIRNYPHAVIYDPKFIANRLRSFILKNESPFPWICIYNK